MANEPFTIVSDPSDPTNEKGLEVINKLCTIMNDVPSDMRSSILMSFIITACGNSNNPAGAWNFLKQIVDQNMPKIMAKVGEQTRSKMN